MDRFDKVLKDIKNIKIQGAENVAKEGIKLLLLKNDSTSVKQIINVRPTEPALKNAIRFVLGLKDKKAGVKLALKHFESTNSEIVKQGSKLIKNNSVVFTHCHSSTVIKILKQAKKQGKKFEVYSSETRPLFQGRKTVLELMKAEIKVTSFVDSAFLSVVKSVKNKNIIMIVGTDAVLKDGSIINKIGTGMFAEICYDNKIPVYAALDSWKYAGHIKIEERNYKEIWRKAPKRIKIRDPAFEKVDVKFVKGIISEFGILKPKQFVKKAKKELKGF